MTTTKSEINLPACKTALIRYKSRAQYKFKTKQLKSPFSKLIGLSKRQDYNSNLSTQFGANYIGQTLLSGEPNSSVDNGKCHGPFAMANSCISNGLLLKNTEIREGLLVGHFLQLLLYSINWQCFLLRWDDIFPIFSQTLTIDNQNGPK